MIDLDLAHHRNLALADRAKVSYSGGANGTYFGPDGVLRTSGTDEPRFDHDPVSGASLGLLVEEARTNLILQSEDLGTTWVNDWAGGVTLTANAATAPDGTVTADQIAQIDGTSDGIQQQMTLTANTTHVVSAFIKNVDSTSSQFIWYDVTGASTEGTLGVTWTAGVPSEGFVTGSAGNSNFKAVGSGWYRVSFTVATDAVNTVHKLTIVPERGTTATNSIYVWGVMVEEKTFSSSYIKTTTAQVTRTADSASIALPAGFSATEGAMYVEVYREHGLAASEFPRLWALSDGSTNERISVFLNSGDSNKFYMLVTDGGVEQANFGIGALSAATPQKHAATWRLNDIIHAADGTLATQDTVATLPTVTTLYCSADAAGTGNFLNGHLGRLVYWPQRLPNGLLQTLTA